MKLTPVRKAFARAVRGFRLLAGKEYAQAMTFVVKKRWVLERN